MFVPKIPFGDHAAAPIALHTQAQDGTSMLGSNKSGGGQAVGMGALLKKALPTFVIAFLGMAGVYCLHVVLVFVCMYDQSPLTVISS